MSLPKPYSIITGVVLCLLLYSCNLLDRPSQDMIEIIMKLLHLKPDDSEKEGCFKYSVLIKGLSNNDLQ